MPLPAAHFRPVQSAVKTANAKVWGVAAVTAQPLAALPPYGCGVPLAGSDRLVQSHSTAGGHWCTAALPDVSLRGAKRRGNLGEAVAARTSHRRPHALPNLTVAAFPAQPLAALPPYGCGVPLAGSDRLVQSHSTAGGHWCTAALPDVSLRGAKRRGNLGEAVAARTSHRRPHALPNLTVAALTAQPLAALPPYGCGVPFTGGERLVQGN